MALIGLQNARKHTLRQDFFRIVDTQEKAYFLGLLVADGWINKKSGIVGLSLIDKPLVELLKQAVGSSVKITTKAYPDRKNCAPKNTLVFASIVMIADLETHGCTSRKSLTLQFPSTIPPSLLHHFVRGYFDGDGCVRIAPHGNCSVDFVGTYQFLDSIQNWFRIQISNFSPVKILSHGRIWRITYHGNFRAIQIRELLYKDATFWLDRKKSIFSLVTPRYRVSWKTKNIHPEIPPAETNQPCK
jgi:hypothetical protein